MMEDKYYMLEEKYKDIFWVFICSFLTIAFLATIAKYAKLPFIFPSLGPTAFLFFATPTLPAASPRNTIIGHTIAITCGYLSLVLCGLTDSPAAFQIGVDGARIIAVSLSIALTGAFMLLLKSPHPPAGATTLIISLGIISKPSQLLIVELAVMLLTLQSIVINYIRGVDYPLWSKK